MNKPKIAVITGILIVAVVAIVFQAMQPSQQEKCEAQVRENIKRDPEVAWILDIPDEKIQKEVTEIIRGWCVEAIEKGETH